MNEGDTYIEKIKVLLSSYYGGETAPEHEAELVHLIERTGMRNLPDEIRSDAETFMMLCDLGASCPDTTLITEIEKEVADESKIKIKTKRYSSAFSGAAAALILILFGFFCLFKESPPESQELLTQNVLPVEAMTTAVEDTIGTIKASFPSGHEKIALKKTDPTPKTETDVAARIEDEYGYIVLEDPEETSRLLEEINAFLSSKVRKGLMAQAEITTIPKKINAILSNI